MRRLYLPLLVLAVAVLVAAAGFCWFGFRSNPATQLAQAQYALAAGHFETAESLAAALQRAGHENHARLVRGEICLRTGEGHMAKWTTLNQLEHAEATLRFALEAGAATASSSTVNAALRVPAGRHRLFPMSEQPRAAEKAQLRERAEAALMQGCRELRAIPEGPLYDSATLLLGEGIASLRELGRHIQLVEICDRLHGLTSRSQDHVEAHRRLAQIYVDLNAIVPAIAELQEVARLDRADGRPCRLLGLFFQQTLREGPASDAYEEALRRDLAPRARTEVLEELCQLHVNQGTPERALEVLKQAPASFQASATAQTIEADALWTLQRRDQARRRVDAALQLNGELSSALRLRARIHLTEEQPGPAIGLLTRALANDPHDEKARHLLMEAYQMRGDKLQAEAEKRRFDDTVGKLRELTELSRAAFVQPWDDEVRLRTAEIWLEMRRPREARTWLRAALAANPRADKARRLLAELDRNY